MALTWPSCLSVTGSSTGVDCSAACGSNAVTAHEDASSVVDLSNPFTSFVARQQLLRSAKQFVADCTRLKNSACFTKAISDGAHDGGVQPS